MSASVPRLARTNGVSREKSDSSSGGLQLQTLLISAVSAVAAATVVPMFWAKGTVIATAMTPVIVALTAEALRRPVQKVTAVAPKVDAPPASASRSRRAGARRARSTTIRTTSPPSRTSAPTSPSAASRPTIRSACARRSGRPWWKIGLATGLLAFVLAAGVVTASELAIFGGSVSGDGGRTSLFGGSTKKSSSSSTSDKEKSSSKSSGKATATPTATPAAARDRDAHGDPVGDRHRHADAHAGRRLHGADRDADAVRRRPRRGPTIRPDHGEGPDPDLAGRRAPRGSRASRQDRRRAISARARRTSRAASEGRSRRSSAATSRRPSRSSPRSGR